MICYVYRSPKKDQMYLYMKQKDEFKEIPEQLLQAFGNPDYSMTIDLDKRDKLARVDINTVREDLLIQGYYLQLPPTETSLLKPLKD